jgi:hypothetical protein
VQIAQALSRRANLAHGEGMDLDSLLNHYFQSLDPNETDETTLARGQERLALDFGIEQEPGRKFGLWVLMNALGIAPAPNEAFDEDQGELRAAAYDWLRSTEHLQS